MRRSAEELIGRYLSGGDALDILREVEDEQPDVQSVRMSLLSDMHRMGIPTNSLNVESDGTLIKVTVPPRIFEQRKSDIMTVAETYSRNYSEFSVVILH